MSPLNVKGATTAVAACSRLVAIFEAVCGYRPATDCKTGARMNDWLTLTIDPEAGVRSARWARGRKSVLSSPRRAMSPRSACKSSMICPKAASAISSGRAIKAWSLHSMAKSCTCESVNDIGWRILIQSQSPGSLRSGTMKSSSTAARDSESSRYSTTRSPIRRTSPSHSNVSVISSPLT